jgi:hypothetical protein
MRRRRGADVKVEAADDVERMERLAALGFAADDADDADGLVGPQAVDETSPLGRARSRSAARQWALCTRACAK